MCVLVLVEGYTRYVLIIKRILTESLVGKILMLKRFVQLGVCFIVRREH